MECKKVTQLILDYLDGTLKSSKCREIEEHLESCNLCRKEIAAYQKTIQLAGSLPVEYPSAEVWNNFIPELLSKIDKPSERQGFINWQFWKRHTWQFAGVAVSIVIIAAIVLNNFVSVTKPQIEPTTVREVIAENLVENISMEQIDQAIESIDYPVFTVTNEMCVDEILAMSEEKSVPDAIGIANVLVTEIDSDELSGDYELLEAIAYLEEYNLSRGE